MMSTELDYTALRVVAAVARAAAAGLGEIAARGHAHHEKLPARVVPETDLSMAGSPRIPAMCTLHPMRQDERNNVYDSRTAASMVVAVATRAARPAAVAVLAALAVAVVTL